MGKESGGRCQDTIEEHMAAIGMAFAECGIGGACRETYQAMIEIAEALRIVHGYAEHKPTHLSVDMAMRIEHRRLNEKWRVNSEGSNTVQ